MEFVLVASGREQIDLSAFDGQFGFPVQSISVKQKGLSLARNAGLSVAEGEVIIFTDDDVRLPPEWVSRMASPILEGRADAAAGNLTMAKHLRRSWMEDVHRAWLLEYDFSNASTTNTMIGAAMAVGRYVLRRVPGFDEALGAGASGGCDDALFAEQVHRAGFRIATVGGPPPVHHFDPKRLLAKDLRRRADVEGRSKAYIDHHWRHVDLNYHSLRWFYACIKVYQTRLWHQVEKRSRFPNAEGLPGAELKALRWASYFDEMRRLRGTPRRYTQYGLEPLPDQRHDCLSVSLNLGKKQSRT